MNKNGWIVFIAIFLFVTVFALSLDNTTTNRVKISSRDIALKNESADVIGGKDVKLNLEKTNITNQGVNAENKGVNITTSSNINNSDVDFNNSSVNYNNQDSRFSSHNNIKYQNVDVSKVDAVLNDAKNISNQRVEDRPPVRRYMYKNIDWNTWKSNFVNLILEDSLNIHELDNYNEGDWLSYSFDVDYNGKITNISVKSFALTQADKDKVARLIKSYEYQDITIFPANTKKKTARVFAVMMLSDTTQKSKPKDFNEFERVKIQY